MRKWRALFAAAKSPRRAVAREETSPAAPHAVPPGPVIAIGGAEDKFERRAILRRFVADAGGVSARIAVIPTASSIPEKRTDFYGEVFAALGAAATIPVPIASRADANSALAGLFEGSSGIFLTGGDQSRLVEVLHGTHAFRAIVRQWRCGSVLGGTSAAASAFSETMIAGGESGLAVRRDAVILASGFGLLPELIIDQHFSQRERLGRLLSAVAREPRLLGIGLDEDTAIVVADDELQVLGSGQVFILDGGKARRRPANGWNFPDGGISIDVLSEGDRYRLSMRERIGASPAIAEEKSSV